MTTKSPTTILEALKILEEAAKDKKEELQSVFDGNYEHLKELVLEKEKSLLKSLHHAKDSAVDAASDLEKEGLRMARELGHDVDKNVHEFPWQYIGGSVLAGLLLGFALRGHRD